MDRADVTPRHVGLSPARLVCRSSALAESLSLSAEPAAVAMDLVPRHVSALTERIDPHRAITSASMRSLAWSHLPFIPDRRTYRRAARAPPVSYA
jgi:hypothetical protein